MEFEFLGFNFSLKRKNLGKLSMNHIDYLNDRNIDFISSKPIPYYQEKVNELIIDSNSENAVVEATKRLDKDGIFIVPNFIDEINSESICSEIENVVESYKQKLGDKIKYEDEDALIQTKPNKNQFKKYSDYANYPKPILNIRTGADNGMVDIFNIDNLLRDKLCSNLFNKIREDLFLNKFLKSLPKSLKMRNINSYVNSGITKTRGFHVDSYKNQIKFFIYLTDVMELKQGPYTFVKGSHKENPFRSINSQLSESLKIKTETPIVNINDIYPILTKKGSLVISDQSGFHRGFPQTKDGFRRTLTINCKQD
tara:strand:- start:2720 stop:3652 length:933 start_codon:yes stop_codon:yes gene_type:complete